MEGLATIEGVKSGEVDIVDILKLNALLDLKYAMEKREMDRARSKG